MKRNTHKSIYFGGNKISEYGIENGYLDYGTLSKAIDAVLVNDITKLFYSTINGEHIEPEIVNGYIDNSEKIEELETELEELETELETAPDEDRKRIIHNTILLYKNHIDELEWEQHESENPEIYQYYIVSDNGADIIKQYTNDPLYYIEFLDVYVWGVTHWGTSWDYVLTDCKLELDGGCGND